MLAADLLHGNCFKFFLASCALPNRGDGRGRTFSVNFTDNVFQCFDAACAKRGDVIDLWASVKAMSLREAAIDLVRTFHLEPAPPKGTEKRHGYRNG
jgi:hypothetical protein